MRFRDIPGQTAIKSYFVDIRNSGKIPHAILISGNPGTGKLALATAFANYIQCKNPIEGDSCGQCASCLKADKIIHPDIHFSFPVVKSGKLKREDVTSKNFMTQWRSLILENPYFEYRDWLSYIDAGNDQGNINKRECIEIIQKLSLTSFESQEKVLILWMAERLGDIGNTLLKLIEEPPPQTILILIADNPNLVLNTIKSRCQLIKTVNFSDSEISSYLNEHVRSKDWYNVVRLSDGNLRKAIDISSGITVNYSEALIQWMRIAYVCDPVQINQWVLNMDKKGKDQIFHFIQYSIHFFRSFHRSFHLSPENIRLSPEEMNNVEKMKTIIGFEQLLGISSILEEQNAYLKRNANAKIILSNMTIKIHFVLKGKTIQKPLIN